MATVEQVNRPSLLPQSDVAVMASDWHLTVLDELAVRLGQGSSFPCPFSRNAFSKQLLRFIFVDGNDDESHARLALGLAEYVEISRFWDGDLNTAYPLIAAFSKEAIRSDTVEGYHEFGWSVLQRLHETDPQRWPGEVDGDPASPFWSMCFNGMSLFCNMSNPAHRVRRSRNLGSHFIFVINPRERFDAVAGNTPAGRKLRASIRSRIATYDQAEHCLQLGTYGSHAVEWQQYGIIEENSDRTDRCPFMFRSA